MEMMTERRSVWLRWCIFFRSNLWLALQGSNSTTRKGVVIVRSKTSTSAWLKFGNISNEGVSHFVYPFVSHVLLAAKWGIQGRLYYSTDVYQTAVMKSSSGKERDHSASGDAWLWNLVGISTWTHLMVPVSWDLVGVRIWSPQWATW